MKPSRASNAAQEPVHFRCSYFTSANRRLVAKAEKGEGGEGGQQQQQPLLRGLFGTLYTLAKEKINDSRNFALATIIIDFILVVLLFIVPEYPWALEEDSV